MPHKHFDMGALKKNTSDYVFPSQATKKCEYLCPSCGNDIIFRCGTINTPHFAHQKNSGCTYYDHPTESDIHRAESEIHKEAKRMLKKLIDDKHNIIVQRKYDCCGKIQTDLTLNTFEYITAQEEYSFTNQDNQIRYADVGLLENGELKYIFEICNTHKTDEKRQTNYKWCEIDAFKFIDDTINKRNLNDDGVIIITCIRTIKCRECLLSSCCGRLYKNELKNKQIAWGKLTKSFECDYVLMESMTQYRSFLIHKKHPLYNGVAFGTFSPRYLTLSKFKQYLLDNPDTEILDHDGICRKDLACKRENLTTYVMLTNEHNEISIMEKFKLRPVHFDYFIIQNLSLTELDELRERLQKKEERERKKEKEKQYLERERLRKKEEREEEERRQYLEEAAERWRQQDKKKLLQKQNDDKEWQLLQKQKQEKKEKQYLERERVRKNLQNNSIKKSCVPKRLNKKIATSNKYKDEKDEDEFQAKMKRIIGDVKCAFTEPTSDDDSVNSLES